MYGEKAEEAEELGLDLEDVKKYDKTQQMNFKTKTQLISANYISSS